MPFHLFLFNEGEGEGDGDPGLLGSLEPKTKPVVETKTTPTTKASIKHPSESEEAYQLRVELEQAKADAQSAKDRIAELNAENLKRRKAAETLEARLNTADKRVIRSAAVEALQDEGVINKRIVDLFLADLGDKAKIDPNTGDAIGIRENLSTWKESNKDFFKALAEAGTQTATTEQTQTETTKKNATSTGASTAGATGTKQATGGMPNLMDLAPKDRRAAVDAYKKSLR